MLALRPALDAQQLFDLMRTVAVTDLYGNGRDDDSGFGMLSVSEGVNATLPTKQATEVDDDVFWLKQDPKKHPTLPEEDAHATSRRRRSSRARTPTTSTPSYAEEGRPADDLGDRGASRRACSTSASGRRTPALRRQQGHDDEPAQGRRGPDATRRTIGYRAKRTGTYYVSVEGPDLPDAAGRPTPTRR